MTPHRSRLEAAAVFATGLLLIGVLYPHAVRNLNTTLFGSTGDGLKNYYTALYHVHHDSTLSHFQGMNYPFGEHVVFTDNQPTLANAIKLADGLIPVAPLTLGIMNGAMLLSIAVSVLFVFLILRDVAVPSWYAAPAAILTAFLSPQILRIGSHHSLSYGWVIPAVWWLAMRLDRRPSLRVNVTIGLVILLAAGLHVYYLAIGGSFLLLWWTIRWLQAPSRQGFRRTVAYVGVQVLLPIAAFQGWMWATDPITDRPIAGGLFISHWEGAFLPIGLPLGAWIDSLVKIRSVGFEGTAYVGLPAAVLSIFVLLRGLGRLARGRWRGSLGIAGGAELRAATWAAALLLLFSFGVPWALVPRWVFESLGPVAQFRSVGRFAWVFFYVVNVVVVWHLFRWGTAFGGRRGWRWAVWWLPMAVLLLETWQYHTWHPPFALTPVSRVLTRATSLDGRLAFDPGRYQAIVPIPYFYVGNETVDLYPGPVFPPVAAASLETGLPLVALYLSRTSRAQWAANLELGTQHDHVPALLDLVDSQKAFLLWQQKSEPLTANDAWLVHAGIPVFENEDTRLLALDPSRWRRQVAADQAKDSAKAGP